MSLREEKGRLVDELVECERTLLLWERKLALERETQEALDPRVGASEIAGMEREVHRMRGRLGALQREQEALVAGLERAIHKREAIAVKNTAAAAVTRAAAAGVGKGVLAGTTTRRLGATAASGASGSGTGTGTGAAAGQLAASTRVGLRQRAAALRAEVEERLAAVASVEAGLAARGDEARTALAAVEERGAAVAAAEAEAAASQRAINSALYERQKAVETAAALQRLLQRLEALEAGKLPRLTGDEASRVADRLHEAEAGRAAVRALVAQLAAQHGELAEILDRVAQLADIAPAAP